jgi:hypothetical protein
MASADVTLAGNSTHEFEVDGTQHTATLVKAGGYLYNSHATEPAYVNVESATVVTTQPVGAGGATIAAGKSFPLPGNCRSFTFKSANSTYLIYTPLV